jgi:phage terminase small subunit
LVQQEKDIRAELESLDIKISREQSQYDEYYKQYEYYEGKTLSPADYEKAERAFDNLNSQTEKVNTMINQQNQLIDQFNEIIIELGCNPNFQIT